MAEDQLVQLLVRLHDKTLKGDLTWEETATDSTFQATFPKYAVQISQRGVDYFLRILDEDGELVEEAGDEELQRMTTSIAVLEKMRTLHIDARRSAKGAAEAVRSILAELDDDIPF